MPTALTTTHLADALDAAGFTNRIGSGCFHGLALGEGLTMGPAFTLQQVPAFSDASGSPAPARHGEAGAKLAAPGDVLVIDVKGGVDCASWGEAHAIRTRQRGVAGVLLNGLVRDYSAISTRGLPVLCRGTSPVRSGGRISTSGMGVALEIAGVAIRPGDIVAFDGDGFVCIPKEISAQILERARANAEKEEQRNAKLLA